MSTANAARLLLLSVVWGGSFILIRIIAPALGPVTTVAARVLIAGLALLVFALATRRSLEFRRNWKHYAVIGGLNCALPFALITFAELTVNASTAAIVNATSPLFGALFAALWLREPITGAKLVGIVLGIGGVVALVGWSPITLTPDVLIAIGSLLGASACYGLSGTYMRARVHGAPLMGMAAGSLLCAAAWMLPLVPVLPPRAMPGGGVIAAVAALALLCTAFAYMIYFRLIIEIGPTRALTVTFLVPAFGVMWGALFLHEAVTVGTVVGCAITLTGTAFVTGWRPAAFARAQSGTA